MKSKVLHNKYTTVKSKIAGSGKHTKGCMTGGSLAHLYPSDGSRVTNLTGSGNVDVLKNSLANLTLKKNKKIKF